MIYSEMLAYAAGKNRTVDDILARTVMVVQIIVADTLAIIAQIEISAGDLNGNMSGCTWMKRSRVRRMLAQNLSRCLQIAGLERSI